MTTLEDRWRADGPSAGLRPASKALTPVAMALSLSINYDEPEPWERHGVAVEEGGDAIAEWKRWFKRYLRARKKRRREGGLT